MRDCAPLPAAMAPSANTPSHAARWKVTVRSSRLRAVSPLPEVAGDERFAVAHAELARVRGEVALQVQLGRQPLEALALEVVEAADPRAFGHLGEREAERLAAAAQIGARLREIERRQRGPARAAGGGRLHDAQRPGRRRLALR